LKTICNLAFLCCSLLCVRNALAQQITISGRVTDSNSGEYLIGAQVYTSDKTLGTITGINGSFSLSAPQSSTIIVSYIGYLSDTIHGALTDTVATIALLAKSKQTDEVTVSAQAINSNIQTTQSGVYRLSPATIRKLPAFLGEADPIRTMSIAPGISQTEGSQGFSVRGTGREQNLVLLNGAPVYNPSHLLGLFSIFNPDAIQEVTLMKSGISAQYGGRLSSVLLVKTGTGKLEKATLSGSIGLLASSLHFASPIKKNKLWVAVSGRKTYLHLISEPITKAISPNAEKTKISYSFSDINTDIEYKANSKLNFLLCMYYGNDSFTFENGINSIKNSINWGNSVASLKWRFVPSEHFSWNNTIYRSSYKFLFDADHAVFNVDIATDIASNGYTSNFYRQLGNNGACIRWGIDIQQHTMYPNRMDVAIAGEKMDFPESQKLYATEPALYCQTDIPLTDDLQISAGIRANNFTHWGPYNKEILAEGKTDTAHFASGQAVASYSSLQPRLSARYLLSEFSSVKASYNYNEQNMHLASMSSSALPADIWFPSTKGVRPMKGHQITTGYFHNFAEHKYASSIELFGKQIRNIGELNDNFYQKNNTAQLNNITDRGTLRSYGAELSLQKITGYLTGGLSATFSRSIMQVAEINNGDPYPSTFDKPFDGSLFLSYTINKKWTVSGYFIYTSGKTATLPVERYLISGNLINYYTGRDQFRMPAYHRLDVSATRTFCHKSGNTSQLVVGFYNIYSRMNPYYIYFETTGDIEKQQLDVQTKSVSFFPILPSASWRFTF